MHLQHEGPTLRSWPRSTIPSLRVTLPASFSIPPNVERCQTSQSIGSSQNSRTHHLVAHRRLLLSSLASCASVPVVVVESTSAGLGARVVPTLLLSALVPVVATLTSGVTEVTASAERVGVGGVSLDATLAAIARLTPETALVLEILLSTEVILVLETLLTTEAALILRGVHVPGI